MPVDTAGTIHFTIEEASPEDATDILLVRHAAFRDVAEFYNDPDLPPLKETLEHVLQEPERYVVLKAVAGGRVVGSVRARETEGVVHVGRLAVLPDYQGKGIGTALASAIIERFPDAVRFELFTGHRSERALAIYRKLGFVEVRREPENENVTLVYMERPGRTRR